MSDTMFPGLTVEKYTISMWRYPSGWWVTIRAYDTCAASPDPQKVSFQIPIGALKVEDLLHLVGEVLQEVTASTP